MAENTDIFKFGSLTVKPHTIDKPGSAPAIPQGAPTVSPTRIGGYA